MDLLYNAVQLVIDAAAVAVVLKAKDRRHTRLGLALCVLASVGATWLFHVDVFHLFRLYAYALFLHAPLALFVIGWTQRSSSRWTFALCATAAIGLLAVAASAFLIEPYRLEVTEVRLESAKVDRPLRIGVLADLQTDRIGAYERGALAALMAADPDLILMPGDYLHEANPARRRALAEELRAAMREAGVRARFGVYATQGNVDGNEWPEFFDGLPVTPAVVTNSMDVGPLRLTALDVWDSFDSGLSVARTERFHVVFGHAPDFALGSVDADLLIAGHTHGGQVRVPLLGPLITFSRVPRSWASGVTTLPGGATLVVSRGVGMERGRAPRMRFLCRPEIVVIDIHPVKHALVDPAAP